MARRFVNKYSAAGLAAGAFVGTGVALLFAPQSGRRTRRDIRLFAEKVGNKAEDKLVEVVNSGKEWTGSKITEVGRTLRAVGKCVVKETGKNRAA
jgi:gas vesicle protein